MRSYFFLEKRAHPTPAARLRAKISRAIPHASAAIHARDSNGPSAVAEIAALAGVPIIAAGGVLVSNVVAPAARGKTGVIKAAMRARLAVRSLFLKC
jgi:hypothetical protein